MKRLLSLLLALAMIAALPVLGAAEETGSIYPLDTDVTLRYWSTCNKPYTAYSSYKESPFHVKLSENTGVNIEWEFPSEGVDNATAYNLMMTDYENYPDIIFYSFDNPQELIDSDILINLEDYIEYAPNLKKYLEENPLVDKAIRTDEGALYMFPWVRGDAWLATFRGMAVRGDWLEELGLAVPETLDELDAVAHAFKEHYGAYFSTNNDWLYDSGISTAFNTWEEFYVDDDQKVQYGPANEDRHGHEEKWTGRWQNGGIIRARLAIYDTERCPRNGNHRFDMIYECAAYLTPPSTCALQLYMPMFSCISLEILLRQSAKKFFFPVCFSTFEMH